jgi:hypothetical protein
VIIRNVCIAEIARRLLERGWDPLETRHHRQDRERHRDHDVSDRGRERR